MLCPPMWIVATEDQKVESSFGCDYATIQAIGKKLAEYSDSDPTFLIVR